MKRDDDRQGTMVRLDEYSHAHTREKEKKKLNQMSSMMLCYITGEKFKDYLTINPKGSFNKRYFWFVNFQKQYVFTIIYHHLKNVKTMR